MRQVSMELPVCTMEDESAIFVRDSSAAFTGQIHWMDKGTICPFSQEILEKMTEGYI